jgi:diguanylate cyclase (GGDEF)-like protein/PAS domain S-box-containing protein
MSTKRPADATALERRLTRERAARVEAESIAERATRELYATVSELACSRAVLDETTDFVAICDEHGAPSYLNRAYWEFLGVEPRDAAGINVFALLTPQSRERLEREALPGLEVKGVWRGEFAMVRSDGGEVPVSQVLVAHRDDAGCLQRISSVARDMSDQLALQAQLEHQALHDPLTGLPNRRLLLDHLDLAVARAHRSHHGVAVLFVDLDGFKAVNDGHGHDVGDAVLVEVADRLRMTTRASDTLARLGGDEFALLCEDLSEHANAAEIAQRLLDGVSGPMRVRDAEVEIGMSIGVAVDDAGSCGPDDLLRVADQAMYEAKRAGKGRYHVAVATPSPPGPS